MKYVTASFIRALAIEYKKTRKIPRYCILVKEDRNNNITIVKGNTYPLRHELKKMGFRWNKNGKFWYKYGKHAYMIEMILEKHGCQFVTMFPRLLEYTEFYKETLWYCKHLNK